MKKSVKSGKSKVGKGIDFTLFEIVSLLADLTVFESLEFNQFLHKLIRLVDQVIQTDSSLVYFYDKSREKLILIGSKNSHDKLLGKVYLKKGEGLTGWAAEHKKTVSIDKEAYKDKRFKVVPELPEDKYEAFLSIPIVGRNGVIGVMNLQSKKPRNFSEREIELVEAIVKIIASAFQKILLEKKLNKLEKKITENKLVTKAKGLLMEAQSISEAQAYKKIQKEAMKQRKSMKEIAEAVILVFDGLS